MEYKLPQLLPHCNYKHFCASCRDRNGGRAFRQGVLNRQGIEGVDVDFECPKQKPWGQQPTSSTGLGDTIAKITKAVGIKPCGGCKKRQEKLNKLLPYKKP